MQNILYNQYLFIKDKEVFVKHEQAPTAPKLEGVWVFVDLKYISYENRYFWSIWQLPVGCFLTEMVEKHIYGPRPLIWAYNQVSETFRSKVLAHTSSSLWKPRFWAILANLTTSGGVFLTEMVKRHIYGPRPFIWAYNQVSMTFHSKALALTRKRWQTDGWTDRHPNP